MTPGRGVQATGESDSSTGAAVIGAPEGSPRVLVVDDDAVDRMAVRRALGKTGLSHASVEEAGDAGDAMRTLAPAGREGEGSSFDCVLLDYELPGTTGLDVLGRMKAARIDVPVVMLTGRSDPETAAALIRAGAVDFISKEALTPERLEQSIRGAIRVARAERELAESRTRLETTLHSIADAVIVLDTDGRVVYMNPAAERLTGWPASDARRRPLSDVAFVVAVDGEGRQLHETLLHERVQEVLGGHRADERTDMTLVARDGTQLFVDATVSALRDGVGAASGVVIAMRDITTRKRTETALSTANEELQRQAEVLEQQAAELEQQFEEARAVATELEQANDRLLEAHQQTERSETRYRALVEASAQLVWTADPDGHVRDVPEWRALTGQTLEAFARDGWIGAIHPDDRTRAAAVWQDALSGQRVHEVEYRVHMADGSYRWYRARSLPVRDAGGAVREWVGTLVDIDDEKRADERRREETDLVETLHTISGALTSELDVERLVQTVTDAATSLTGAEFGAFFYNRIDAQGERLTLYALSGAPRSAFESFGHPRPTPIFAPTFYGTGIVRSDEITKDPRYGKMAPYHGMPPGHLPVRSYLAVPVISRSGEVLGGLFFGHAAVGVFTERAERLAVGIAASAAVAMDNARLYEAERRARGEAEAANKAKSQFLANMSHELRTPLNAIGGYADLVLEGIRGPITAAQRADIERIKRSQRHLLSLINDILNFAKIEAGRVRFTVTDVPLSGALAELETLVAPQLREKGIRYEYRCTDPAVVAHADGERMQQILLNLVSNAVKFTPQGGEIVVECEGRSDAVVIRVRDSGIGIPGDKLEHIFEPFVQLDAGERSHTKGTGLGLAISRDLARSMQGDLTAESVVDKGSTFTLVLPRAR